MSMNGEAVAVDGERAVTGPVTSTVYDSIYKELKETQTKQKSADSYRSAFEELAEKTYSGKRSIDLFIGLAGLLVFLFLYPFIALGIKLFSNGPVIYKQRRTGQNGEEFICFKFRTMHQVDLRRMDGKPVVTQKGDRRIFGFGSLLRRLNLDELPQVLNVLKGEMSLVGPRPYPVEECMHWNNTFEDFFYRYSVKPGVTGWAQANGYRGGTLDEEHMRRRLDKDLIYVEKQSMGLDLKIIGKTILQMVHLDTNGH